MRIRTKVFVLVILIFSVIFLMPSFMDDVYYSKASDEAEWSIDDPVDDDTFSILEIVPYEGMAEIGYLIGGQEPVEKSRMSIHNAANELSFLGEAIHVYPSYNEKAIPSSNTPEAGWFRARTVVNTGTYSEGYYEDVGVLFGGATHYRTTGDVVYEQVPNGTGEYIATLGLNTRLENTYRDVTDPIHRKNVEAYFVFEHPPGIALLNENAGYEPYSVTETPDYTGDYDYDCDSGKFILNKGRGKYNVLFVISANTNNVYHMTTDYKIVTDQSGDYSVDPRNFTYIMQTGGNYSRVQTYNYVEGTNWLERLFCNYVYRSAAFPPGMKNYGQDSNGNMWVRTGGTAYQYYQYTYHVELVNNEWFKRMVLGIPSHLVDKTPVSVRTITPEELNDPVNQSLIDSADLIYINANYNHNANYIRFYETYNTNGINRTIKYMNASATVKQNNLSFATHDLSWKSVEKIFRKVAGIGCMKAGIVFDSTFYTNAINGTAPYNTYNRTVTITGVNYQGSNRATSVNMAKLFIMLYQRNRVDFYNTFLNKDFTNLRQITEKSVDQGINYTRTTGYYYRPNRAENYTGNEVMYWNGNTFLPYGLNTNGQFTSFTQGQFVSQGIFNYNTMQVTTDILYNLLLVGGNNVSSKGIFDRHFTVPLTTTIPADVQPEVINHLRSIYGTNFSANQLTPAHLLNYIMNNGQGYRNTGGVSYPAGGMVEGIREGISEDLNTAHEDGTDGSNTRTFKRVLNIQPTASFADGETAIRTILAGQEVQIVNMTSTQFNGSIEDINVRYDMIYMGSSGRRFHIQNNQTDFNRADLDGAVYFTEGDQVLAKNLRTNYRYRGNDLSEQRVRDLNGFLAAGYPIVADETIYQANTNIIRNNTRIYGFINAAKATRPNFLNLNTYTTNQSAFLNQLNNGLNVIRPRLELVEPSMKGSGVNYIYVNSDTDLFTVKFKLSPKGIIPSPYTYNAYLYLDQNGDGIFDEEEKLTAVSVDTTSWLGIRESFTKKNTYQYNMSDLHGVYQWKIVVKRNDYNGNETPEIRSSLTGYVANKLDRRNLNILHIVDGESSYRLQTMIEDTSKLINYYTRVDQLADYHLSFQTMTVQQFQDQYAGEDNVYTTEHKAQRNKLSQYHLLIMDNPRTPISEENGAALNLRDEIKKNLSVVFTKNALGFERQDTYYGGERNSFTNQYTYNYINDDTFNFSFLGYTYQYYNYSNMVGDYGTDLTSSSAYRTNYLTKTNEGNITRYPYQIKDALAIADNYYSNQITVDFDLTQSNRFIGWYALSDSRSPVVRTVKGLTGNANELYLGTYSSSPNDVRNNYYLFSNGLCFYSGIQLAAADKPGNDEEIMLFINTMIAAYEASDREVSHPPMIEIIDPEPDMTDGKPSKVITSDMISEHGNLDLYFKITQSTSIMDLDILFEGETGLTGNWNQTVDQVDAARNIIDTLIIDHADANQIDKADNGVFVVRIPKDQLIGSNTLTIAATNAEGNKVQTKVELKWINPPVVEITNPVPAVNRTASYIYVDIDYSADEEVLHNAPQMKVYFDVTAAGSFRLQITSHTSLLTMDDLSLYKVKEDGSEDRQEPDFEGLTEGSYVIHIPLSHMINRNSREFVIEAIDPLNYSGSASFVLLRRNLFPLD